MLQKPILLTLLSTTLHLAEVRRLHSRPKPLVPIGHQALASMQMMVPPSFLHFVAYRQNPPPRGKHIAALPKSSLSSWQIRSRSGQRATRRVSPVAVTIVTLTYHQNRIRQSKTIMIGTWLKDYEQAREDVAKLKQQYILKMRRADDAEDESVPPSNHRDLCSSSSSVKFAPLDSSTDKYTSSPRIRPLDGRKPLQRSATVSERISASLKQFQKKSADALAAATTPSISHDLSIADDGKSPSKVDKGKGKEQVNNDMPQGFSLPPISPPDDNTPSVPPKPLPRILLAGLSFPPSSISQLLTRAAAELPLRPVKFPLLGEYQDAFTGEEFVTWLKDNVEGFGGNLDHAEEAARTLTEAENVLRRLGELGNQFESSDEAFYQFRSRVIFACL